MRACVCVLLLFQLLTVNPEHRFSSLSDMQTSPYLADISWDAVYQKQMEAGFVPNVSLNMLHATHTPPPFLQIQQSANLASLLQIPLFFRRFEVVA